MLSTQQTYSLQEIPFFSSIFLDYVLEKDPLKEFYSLKPALENFTKALSSKIFPQENRLVLQDVFQRQYQTLNKSQQVTKNIQALSQANTFAVTTAHQPSIFFGELYFIFKTLSTIRLAEVLQAKYPEFRFVPIFWLGSEDHDFAEISHFRLFGKTYHWQHHEQGAVGRMSPQSLQELLQEMPEKEPIFERAYQQNTLAQATQYALNAFFGEKGLLVLDADDKELKKLFAPIIRNELFAQKTFEIVSQNNDKLNTLGYKAQATPREINLFYLENQLRKRIVRTDTYFEVLDTDKKFSATEIETELQESPEKFSPNALLRPLYQETILPNLAYIGGPGELAYWLQLKEVFSYFASQAIPHLQMPILMPRFFGAILQKNQIEKMQKLHIQFSDLWQEPDLLRKNYVAQHTDKELDLRDEKKNLEAVFEQIKVKAMQIDKSLEGSVAAEWQKTLKSIENIEKRIQKAEERNQETQIAQILALREKVFPENNLQERKDNFLNFHLNYPSFLEDLSQIIQPFQFAFQVLKID